MLGDRPLGKRCVLSTRSVESAVIKPVVKFQTGGIDFSAGVRIVFEMLWQISGGIMRTLRAIFIVLVLSVIPLRAGAQEDTAGQVEDRIIAQEHQEITPLKQFSPLVETYIQQLRPHDGRPGLGLHFADGFPAARIPANDLS